MGRAPLQGWSRLARGTRLRERLAREHFVAVGGHVDEGSDDDGHLLHVGLLDALVDIHVGVMRTGVVVHGVLNELETGKADGVVGKVIGSAGIANAESGHSKIVEGFHPGGEKRSYHFVALKVDAANLAGGVVDVEVGVEFGVFGKSLDYIFAGLTHFGIGEVLLDVGARAEKPLFLAGPEAEADGTAHLEAGSLENADGFEHDSGTSSVVGGAGSPVPGIEVPAEHDD